MKDMFPEYYCEPDFDELWKQAIFVFDTNVLLDIFRFSPETSGELIEVLEGLKDTNKIWIPYQFAYEYHKNLMSVRKDIKDERREIKKLLRNVKKELEKELNRLSTRAGFKVSETHIKEVKSIFDKILRDLSNFENKYKSNGDGDHLAEKIDQLFAGNIGECDSDPRIKNISSIGKQRFDRKIPPGFKDANKDKSDPFGDLVGWFQMIAHAKKESKPLILVSNDHKGNDWFLKQNNQLQPRPELRKEMRNEANVDFYLYITEAFMKCAKDYLNSQVSEETIEEIENHGRYILRPEWTFLDKARWALSESNNPMKSILDTLALSESNNPMKSIAAVVNEITARNQESIRFIMEDREAALRSMRWMMEQNAQDRKILAGLASQISGFPTNDDDSNITNDDDNGDDDST